MMLEPVGHVTSPYLTKLGVPRQPGLAPAVQSRIVFLPGRCSAHAALGLYPGDWVMVLWCFSHNIGRERGWFKTVRPPILGGTKRQGVFATRSSFRPNGLALSCVEILQIESDAICIAGGDMVDGTPVYDIFPYDSRTDCPRKCNGGWMQEAAWPQCEQVEIDEDLISIVPESKRSGLLQVLMQDPRPAYTRTGREDRVFWTAFDDCIIRFSVSGRVLHVHGIEKMSQSQTRAIRETGSLPK